MLTTQDKHYLCCQGAARLEVSLAGEIPERAVKVSCDQSSTQIQLCSLSYQISRPFTNLLTYEISSRDLEDEDLSYENCKRPLERTTRKL